MIVYAKQLLIQHQLLKKKDKNAILIVVLHQKIANLVQHVLKKTRKQPAKMQMMGPKIKNVIAMFKKIKVVQLLMPFKSAIKIYFALRKLIMNHVQPKVEKMLMIVSVNKNV